MSTQTSRISLVGKPLTTPPTPFGSLRKCPRCGRSGAAQTRSDELVIVHVYERSAGAWQVAQYRLLDACHIPHKRS